MIKTRFSPLIIIVITLPLCILGCMSSRISITADFKQNNQNNFIINNVQFYNISLIKEDDNYFLVYNIENTSDSPAELNYRFQICDKKNNVIDTMQIKETLKPHQKDWRKSSVKGSDGAFVRFFLQFEK